MRTFSVDVLVCPGSGGRLRLVAGARTRGGRIEAFVCRAPETCHPTLAQPGRPKRRLTSSDYGLRAPRRRVCERLQREESPH